MDILQVAAERVRLYEEIKELDKVLEKYVKETGESLVVGPLRVEYKNRRIVRDYEAVCRKENSALIDKFTKIKKYTSWAKVWEAIESEQPGRMTLPYKISEPTVKIVQK